MVHLKEKKSTETIPEKDLMADILEKDSKTSMLKVHKELKDDMEEIKKMMYEQNRKINKKAENWKKKPKRNSGAQKYNTWSEKIH